MSETTPSPSTLTSPRSPLFSDSERLGAQSGTELITSDEEPDLGAFTTVLRAWGHLQPPIRIPTHLHQPSSSTTRSTITTLTGYPGLGSNSGSETIEESTVWNQRPIQSYLLSASRETGVSSSTSRGERIIPEDDVVLEESEDEVPSYPSSPPVSPTVSTEGSRTVEIASETDSPSLHDLSLTLEDGASGERFVIQVATPPSVEGRTVSVASAGGGESHDGQARPLHPQSSSTSALYMPQRPVVNDISTFSDVSAPSLPTHNGSGQPLDDNTSTSRPRTYTPMLSLISQAPERGSSVFQESPSPAITNNVVPFQEPLTATSPTLSIPPSRPPTLSRLNIDRLASGLSSHLESDIVNSYFIQRPPRDSSSSDQPATDSPWSRTTSHRLAIVAPPRPRPNSLHARQHHDQPPLQEQEYLSPFERERRPRTPSVVDDNSSSTSAAAILMERSSPPSATTTTSAVLSMLRGIVLNGNAGGSYTESSGVESSHSLTPSHADTLMFSPNSSTTMDEFVRRSSVGSSLSHHHPRHDTSFSTNFVDADDSSALAEDLSSLRIHEMMQRTGHTSMQYIHHHSLSQEADPEYEQPSLGYLDEALKFIAEERARLTAAREGLFRESSPHRGDNQERQQRQEREEIAAWKHAIELESRHKKRKKYTSKHSATVAATATSSAIDSMCYDINTITPKSASTIDRDRDHNENIIILNSPKKKKKKDRNSKVMTGKGRSKSTSRLSQISDINTISILKRPDRIGSIPTDPAGKYSEVEENLSPSSAPTATVEGLKYDGSITPRAHHYLYSSWSSDNPDAMHDAEDEEDEEGERIRGLDSITTTGSYHPYTHRNRNPTSASPNTPRFVFATPRAVRSRVHLNLDSTNDEDASEENRDAEGDLKERREKKKYRKKSRSMKRKIPVTTHISTATAGQAATTLLHSHSVPNLRLINARSDGDVLEAEKEEERSSSERDDVPEQLVLNSSAPFSSARWKGRKKAKKPAFILRGDPQHSASTFTTADGDVGGSSKRGRLIALAHYLQALFPEERDRLQRVIVSLHRQTKMPSIASFPRKGAGRAISKDYRDRGDESRSGESEEEDPDPRGEAAGSDTPPVHVFIDHSNILIGLLTHLKRRFRSKAKLKAEAKHSQLYSTADVVTHAAKHSLSVPTVQNGVFTPAAKPLIPLPSFATARTSDSALSRSAPSTSLLGQMMAEPIYASSDGDDPEQSSHDEQEVNTPVFASERWDQKATVDVSRSREDGTKKMQRVSRHLWHAALALILERGRAITRRVVVASSPLYQPMENIEHLGYEVKIFMRVPDLREGGDRVEKGKPNDTKEGGSPVNGSPMPIKSSGYGLWRGSKDKVHSNKRGHVRHKSDIVSGGDVSLSAILQQQQLVRVKYREQGVDELLQLKLHQAIADTDNVPEGATIILATGDGNVGQFNDDGFLGPVRTALRRGWKVELYAWEEGLSRSWQREFGPSSEWGRKGMFRIIAMEQFADSLVDMGKRQSHPSA